MHDIVNANPFRCRMWSQHDRLEEGITVQSCRSEIESIATSGQMLPVLGRPVRHDPEWDIELIYGARRLFVARHLNLPLRVDLRELSDREAVVAMDAENRLRADISPYERGVAFLHWLRTGLFGSQDEIARTLKVSPSQVSRLIKLAQLPSVVVSAFRDPTQICERWGVSLYEAWQDPARRSQLASRARNLGKETGTGPLAGDKVYEALLEGVKSPRGKPLRFLDVVVLGRARDPLFRVRRYKKKIALIFSGDEFPNETLEEIKSSVARIIEMSRARTEGFPVAQGCRRWKDDRKESASAIGKGETKGHGR